MNAKKVKLLRRVGKLDNQSKKLYNTLSHQEKGFLSEVYTEILNNSTEDGVSK
tara:strand:+ start:3456 stop:3614 length:159 start_codon:yes stop_codon:yes gene_type:complete